MSASLDTTARKPKTTEAADAWPTTLAEWQAKKAALVQERFAEASTAVAGFPTLMAHLEAWLPLRQSEGDLEAAHAYLEESGAPEADLSHADDLWSDARAVTRAVLLRLLNAPTSDPDEIIAKVSAFVVMSDRPVPELKDDEGADNVLVQSLLHDVSELADARRSGDTAAWDKAVADWRAAAANCEAVGGHTATEHEAAMQEAVILARAPHLKAVALKLSFIGEFHELTNGEFLTPVIAAGLLTRSNDWRDRCLAAAFIDLTRMAAFWPVAPSVEASKPASADHLADAEFEPWVYDSTAHPTHSYWQRAWDPHGKMLAVAYTMMTKSKPELIEAAASMGGMQEDDGGALWDLVQRLKHTQTFLRSLADMLEGAETRMLVATHALFKREGWGMGEDAA